ncbi:MAG: DUF4276 family protein [Treponema sp.]|nr:DUF4276 family protein [Treponema sp.]
MIYYTSVFEDEITHQVMLKIYNLFKGHFSEYRAIPCYGKGKVKKQIKAYNNAAQHGYYFVIADLDNEYECAPSLIHKWLSPEQANNKLLFRIAVHEIESWLLADKKNFSAFFSISHELIPSEPDKEIDPKSIIVSLAKKSRKRDIREAIVPIDNYALIGPGYNSVFQNFIQNFWSIASARKNSPSLDGAIKSFERMLINEKHN